MLIFTYLRKLKNFYANHWNTSDSSDKFIIVCSLIIIVIIQFSYILPILKILIELFPLQKFSYIYWFLLFIILTVISVFVLALIIKIISLGTSPIPRLIKDLLAFLLMLGMIIWVCWILDITSSEIRSDTPNNFLTSFSNERVNFGSKNLLIASNIQCQEQNNRRKDLNSEKHSNNIAEYYERYLELCPNDPEIQIYLNNKHLQEKKKNMAIAVAVPISGEEDARESQEILRGVAIAQNQWNNNENNQDLQVAIAIADYGDIDNKKEQKSSKRISELLANEKEILGVIGHFSTQISEVIAPIYKENKLVAISTTSTTKRKNVDNHENGNECFENKGRSFSCLNSYIFRTTPIDEFQLRKIVDIVGDDKLGLIYERDNVYSRSYISSLEKLIVSEKIVKIKEDNCNFSKYESKNKPELCLNKIIDKYLTINKLLLVPSFKSKKFFDEFIKKVDLIALKNKKLLLLGSDSMYSEKLARKMDMTGRNDTQGMQISVPWHRKNSPCEKGVRRLECKATKLFSNKNTEQEEIPEYIPFKINWRTATAYDATLAMLNGLKISNEHCKSLKFGKSSQSLNSCMRDNLKHVLLENEKIELSKKFTKLMKKDNDDQEGALGLILFDEKGDRKNTGTSTVVEIKNGNFEIYQP